MPDRQQVEQGRRQSKAGKADEDDRDHRVADKGNVSPQRRHNILGFHHGLTLLKESSPQGITIVCPRNHPAYKSYIKFWVHCSNISHDSHDGACAAEWRALGDSNPCYRRERAVS
jgi:hypothetical protein